MYNWAADVDSVKTATYSWYSDAYTSFVVVGAAANVFDNNYSTYYGTHLTTASSGNSRSYHYQTIVATSTFAAARSIDQIIANWGYSNSSNCSISGQSYTLEAYYGGAWHTISSGSFGASNNLTFSNLGLTGVTAVRLTSYLREDWILHAYPYNYDVYHNIYELVANGEDKIYPARVSTLAPTNILTTNAMGNGIISYAGGAGAVDQRGFDYGLTTAYGSSVVDSGSFSEGAFSKSITGLTEGQTYHYRAKIHNVLGWTYGNDRSFIMGVTGVNGGIGQSVAQNLKVTFPGDGSDHGGSVQGDVQSTKTKIKGSYFSLQGCTHSCPITGHGTTPISPLTVMSFVEGKLIITDGAVAGCGAVISSPNRTVYIE